MKLINWMEVQEYYDAGHSCRECSERFSISNCSITKAKKRGRFITRTHAEATMLYKNTHNISEKHKKLWTPELRERQSMRKKELYRAHPEKHPNRKLANNKVKMSYPEWLAFCYFTDNKFNFKHNEPVGEFFPDFIIDDDVIVEIDGERWHNKESDARRDIKLKDLGFKIIRFSAKNIISQLNNHFGTKYTTPTNTNPDLRRINISKRISPPKKMKSNCIECGKPIHELSLRCNVCENQNRKNIAIGKLDKTAIISTLIKTNGNMVCASRLLGISDNGLRKQCNNININWKDFKIDQKNYCNMCNKILSNKKTKYCCSCINIINEICPIPPKEEFMLTLKNCNFKFKSVGIHYNTSLSSVQRWLKKYGLPTKQKDLKLFNGKCM